MTFRIEFHVEFIKKFAVICHFYAKSSILQSLNVRYLIL